MPKSRSARILILILAIIAICVLGPAIVNLSQGGGKSTHTITYKVEGTAKSAMVTLINATGGTEQSYPKVPFSYEMEIKPGAALSIVAQNQSNEGSITCEIIQDGKSIKSSKSEGAFVVVTCADVAR